MLELWKQGVHPASLMTPPIGNRADRENTSRSHIHPHPPKSTQLCFLGSLDSTCAFSCWWITGDFKHPHLSPALIKMSPWGSPSPPSLWQKAWQTQNILTLALWPSCSLVCWQNKLGLHFFFSSSKRDIFPGPLMEAVFWQAVPCTCSQAISSDLPKSWVYQFGF